MSEDNRWDPDEPPRLLWNSRLIVDPAVERNRVYFVPNRTQPPTWVREMYDDGRGDLPTAGGTFGDITRSTYTFWRSQVITNDGLGAITREHLREAFGDAYWYDYPPELKVGDGL